MDSTGHDRRPGSRAVRMACTVARAALALTLVAGLALRPTPAAGLSASQALTAGVATSPAPTAGHTASRTLPAGPAPSTVPVPAGSFVMGDSLALCASGIRDVTLTRDYEIGRTEVTNAEFVEALQWAYDAGLVAVVDGAVVDLLGDGAFLVDLSTSLTEIVFLSDEDRFAVRQSPYALQFAYPSGYAPEDHPVKRISWNGAAAFCDWLNLRAGLPLSYDHTTWVCNGGDPYGALGYRLPTDAEWERAARFDDGRIHPWGDEPATCARANHANPSEGCGRWTEPVGSRPDGASALGLLDAGGNAGEWCNDWHQCALPSGTFIDPVGPETGAKKVLRGGGFFYAAVYTRCGNRDADPPGFPFEAAGFRIARTLPDPASLPGGGGAGGDGASDGRSEETGTTQPADGAFPFRVESPSRSGTLLLVALRDAEGALTVYDANGRVRTERRLDVPAGREREVTTALPAGVYWLVWEARAARDARSIAVPWVRLP